MQLGTVANIGKIVFAIAVIAILIYIAVKNPAVIVGNWTIDGSDGKMLKFISPDKSVVFAVDQDNKGVRVQNYLIKGDEHGLQFFDPAVTQMARMRSGELDIGALALVDNTQAENRHDRGLVLTDMRRGKTMAVVTEQMLRWPEYDMILKTEKEDGKSNFQVYTGNAVVLQVPKTLGQTTRYNII